MARQGHPQRKDKATLRKTGSLPRADTERPLANRSTRAWSRGIWQPGSPTRYDLQQPGDQLLPFQRDFSYWPVLPHTQQTGEAPGISFYRPTHLIPTTFRHYTTIKLI